MSYIGHVQLKQLTPAMIDNMFQKHFEKGLSQSTVRYTQRILSVSMEAARKYRYIDYNPARDIITKCYDRTKDGPQNRLKNMTKSNWFLCRESYFIMRSLI